MAGKLKIMFAVLICVLAAMYFARQTARDNEIKQAQAEIYYKGVKSLDALKVEK